MNRRRVAVVVPFLRGGGAERVIINVLRHIDKERFDIRLVLVEKAGAYVPLIPDDVTTVDLRTSRVRYALPRLVKELNSFRPDVVLSTLGYMNLALIASRPLLRGRPRIIVRDANLPSKEIKYFSPLKKGAFSLMYKLLYPRADLIVVQCDDMKVDLIAYLGCSPDLLKRIYNPVDLESIRRACEEPNPFHSDETNILAVGSFLERKGFDILIDAFSRVVKHMPDARLTIIGDGPLRSDLRERAELLGVADRVSLPGFVVNPYPYYRFADAYVLSSRWEGLPNTLLEALACGAKVVATDCRTGPREILMGGRFGELVKPEDPAALASAILNSLSEPSRSGDRALDFDVRKIVREYEEVLAG